MNSDPYAYYVKLAAYLKIAMDQRLEWVENKAKEAQELEDKKEKEGREHEKEAREHEDRRHWEDRKEQQKIRDHEKEMAALPPLLTTDLPQLEKGPLHLAHTRKMVTKCSQTG